MENQSKKVNFHQLHKPPIPPEESKSPVNFCSGYIKKYKKIDILACVEGGGVGTMQMRPP